MGSIKPLGAGIRAEGEIGTVPTDLLPLRCDLPVPTWSVGSKNLALSPWQLQQEAGLVPQR